MEVPIRSRLLVLLSTLLLMSCGGGDPGTFPRAFWVSQPVNKDETMLITAGNLVAGGTTVELAELGDEDPGDPASQTPSISNWTALTALTSTSRSLTATVPADWGNGVYALRLRSGAATDAIRLVNAPDPWFVQGDLGDTATPGGSFTVAGTALERTGGLPPQAALVNKETGALVKKLALAERITTSTGYALRFDVPPTVPEGDYQLWLHNGRGGKAAWVRFSTFIDAPLDTVTVKQAKVWPTTVFDISSYGGTDDEKFAAALAETKANGGGKIYVPAGTYALTKQLALPAYTVLAGAGRDSSLIKWDVAPDVALVVGETLLKGSVTRATFALEDIRLTVNATGFIRGVVDRSFTKEYGWLKRVGIFAPVTAETVWDKTASALVLRQTANTLLDDVLMDTPKGIYAREDVSYLKLVKSVFRWNNVNIWLSSQSHNFLMMDNRFEKRGPLAVQASLVLSAFYGAKPYTRDMLWTGNVVTQVASDNAPMTSGYTMDGGNGIYLGGVIGVSGTRLNLASATVSTDVSGKSVSYSGLGYVALIIDGRGAGQWRNVKQAEAGGTSLTVDRPWDVEPDVSSTLTVVNMQGRVLMIDNDYVRDTQHDDYYLALDSIKAGNRFGVDGKATAATTWAGSHYQGTFPTWHLQFLGNHVERGSATTFNANINNDPETGYRKDVAAAHVYRNNANTSAGLFNLRLSSDVGGAADMLLENNQADNIIVRRWDAKKKRDENTDYSGVLIKGNHARSGTASTIQTVGDVPAGIRVLP